MRYIFVIAIISCVIFTSFAQSYNTALGLRMMNGIGVTLQQRVADKTTIEGILNSRFNKDLVTATVLGEQHIPLLFKRFNLYGGGGLHKGWYSRQKLNNNESLQNPFGVTLIGGAEISLGKFNISYDIKPSFNLTGGETAVSSASSLSIRYVIHNRPTKFQKWKDKRKKRREQKKKNNDGFKWEDIFKRKN